MLTQAKVKGFIHRINGISLVLKITFIFIYPHFYLRYVSLSKNTKQQDAFQQIYFAYSKPSQVFRIIKQPLEQPAIKNSKKSHFLNKKIASLMILKLKIKWRLISISLTISPLF